MKVFMVRVSVLTVSFFFFSPFVVLGAVGGIVSPVSWPADAKPLARAILEPRSGSNVSGTVDFATTAGGGLLVRSYIKGATPGDHGFHIHAVGDCSAADGKSAGDHFNPTGEHHGAPKGMDHHAGDMGNIEVTANGQGTRRRNSAQAHSQRFCGLEFDYR